MACLRPISTSLITMNIFIKRKRIKLDTLQSTTPTWFMGGGSGILRLISTSPININTFYTVSRVIVSGLLRPISTSSIFTTFVTMMINSAISIGIVDGPLKPKSKSSVTHIYSNTSIIINTIVINMGGGRMAGLLRPISKTSITTYV